MNTRGQIAVRLESSGFLKYYVWGYGTNNSSYTYKLDAWIHVVATYSGGSSGQKLYVDGVELDLDAGNQGELDLLSGAHLHIGHLVNGTGALYGSRGLNGSLSNFKLYDCALTAEEVKRLYDMGRCDEGHHVVNFSKTRVGIGLGDGETPSAALDVRGDFYLNNNLVLGRYVGFSVYRSSATTGGDANPVVWNAVWAKSIEFNDLPNTTGFYRIPYTGKYLFTFYCIAGGTLNMQLFKNSSASTSGRTFTKHVPYDDKGTGEGTWFQLTGNGIEDFAAGEYVHVTTSGSFYGQSSNPHNGFSLTFLGA